MERISVRAMYRVGPDSPLKHLTFVARVKDSSNGYKLAERAQRAAGRRENIPASQIKIVGVMGD